MREIAAAIREGAIAYLWRQYKTIGMVGVVLFVADRLRSCDWAGRRRVGFVIGAVLSGRLRHHRHERLGARQRAHRRGRAHRPERGAAASPSTAARSPACWWSAWRCSASPATSRFLYANAHRQDRPRAHHPPAGRPRLRRLADLDLRASGRRHLHQGRRRRRRPGRQGRGRHPRGRPAQPGGDRRQRRRQRRRLRRHGGGPVRDLRRDHHRHHAARRADGEDRRAPTR